MFSFNFKAACTGIVVLTLPACTSLFFYPMREHVQTPSALGVQYEDVYLGESPRIHGWFLPAIGQSKGTVLFLHGNAENVSTHVHSVAWLPDEGFSVFALEYPGYGASKGSPTLEGIIEGVRLATKYLRERNDSALHCLFLYGESLGGAIALYVAATTGTDHPFCGVISQSAFSSYRGIAGEKLDQFWLTRFLASALLWTIDNRFDPLPVIQNIAPTPLLIIHGTADQVVPVHHARQLFAAAQTPRNLWELHGAGHIQALRTFPQRQRFVEFLTAQHQVRSARETALQQPKLTAPHDRGPLGESVKAVLP